MNTTRRALTAENLVVSDRAQAEAAGTQAAETDALELAPLSYAAMKAANGRRELGALLEALADHLVRPQAVRFLVERQAATGQRWSWGDVDEVERRFRRLIGETRQAALNDLVEEVTMQIEALADCGALAADAGYDLALEEAYPDCRPDGEPGVWTWARQPAIVCRPTLSADLVDAILARHEGDTRSALVKAEALGDDEPIRALKARAKALGKAREYLARAADTGATLATQLLDGGWSVVGSKGERHRLTRQGVALSCGCPHGRKLQAGEKAAGVCWHSELIPAIEEAQDEAAASYGLAA